MKKWEVRGGGGTSADEDICVDARLHSDKCSLPSYVDAFGQ